MQLRASVLAIRALGRHYIELFFKKSKKNLLFLIHFQTQCMLPSSSKDSWLMFVKGVPWSLNLAGQCRLGIAQKELYFRFDLALIAPQHASTKMHVLGTIPTHLGISSCVIWPWDSVPHDDVIKWKHFPRYWPFVRGIHRSPVNSPHKGQWRGSLMGFFICVWINDWVNNREAGGLRRCRAHYDVTVMKTSCHTVT